MVLILPPSIVVGISFVLQPNYENIISLAPSASVMHLGMFLAVCMSVRMRNSKTIAPIDLILF